MPNKIDIAAFSDPHGQLPIVEPFDLLLIGGDICPPRKHYFAYQIEWFQHEFAEWVKDLPFKDDESKVVLIGGNHDFFLERIEQQHIDTFNVECDNRLVYLQSTEYLYHNKNLEKPIKIFGSPWCTIFYDWAFMINDGALAREYEKIPDDCDILISHDSPTLGGLGWITEGRYINHTTGNKILSEYIEKKKPRVFMSGHFHSGVHGWQKIGDTWLNNISYIGEDYKPRWPITYFEWPLNLDKDEH